MTRISKEMDAIKRWLEGQPLPRALNTWLLAMFLTACATATPGASPTEIPGSLPTPTNENPTTVPATEVAPTPDDVDSQTDDSLVISGTKELKPEYQYGFTKDFLVFTNKNITFNFPPVLLSAVDKNTQTLDEFFRDGTLVFSTLRSGFEQLFAGANGGLEWNGGKVTQVNQFLYTREAPNGETEFFFAGRNDGYMVAYVDKDGVLTTAVANGEGVVIPESIRPAFVSLDKLADQIGGYDESTANDYDTTRASDKIVGVEFEQDAQGKFTGNVVFKGEHGDVTTLPFVRSEAPAYVEYSAANIARSLAFPEGVYTLVQSQAGDQLLDSAGKVVAQENADGVFVPVEVGAPLTALGYPHNPNAEGYAATVSGDDISITDTFGGTVALLDVKIDPDGALPAWKLEAKAQKIVDAVEALGLPANVDYDVTTGADGTEILVQITATEPLEVARWNGQTNAWEKVEHKDTNLLVSRFNLYTKASGEESVPFPELPLNTETVLDALTSPVDEGGWALDRTNTSVIFAFVLPVSPEEKAALGSSFEKEVQLAIPNPGERLSINPDGTVDCSKCIIISMAFTNGPDVLYYINPDSDNNLRLGEGKKGDAVTDRYPRDFKFYGSGFRARDGESAPGVYIAVDKVKNARLFSAIASHGGNGQLKIDDFNIDNVLAFLTVPNTETGTPFIPTP